MKPGRQNVIYEIIAEQEIETQHQLLEALAARGIRSTQATLSRDIKDMGLVKQLGPNGTYRYAIAGRSGDEEAHQRLKTIFRESVLSFDVAQNLLVVKTLPGLAMAACSAIDANHIEAMVGSIAGDDTAFLAMRDAASALELYHTLETLFEK